VTGTIGCTAPLFAVLGAAVFLAEPLGSRALIATGLIVLGSIALASPRVAGGRQGGASWLPWSAAALRALAQVLSKAGLALWASPFAAALVGYTVSSAAVWATALGGRRQTRPFNRRGVAWFALTGALNGAAVLSLYHALSRGPVTLVSPIAATYPLFTLLLSAIVLRQQRLSAPLIGGVALTVTGIVVLLAP
jgi:uncharacterized membrane protein